MKRLSYLIGRVFHLCVFFVKGGVVAARRLGVAIGDGCRIYIYSWGSEPFLISIGDRVTVTSGVKFLTHDGSTCLVKNSQGSRFQRYGRISVGSDVFIGVNAIIMSGVTIGDNVVIGAGSVVTRSVSSNSVVAGNPARLICGFDVFHERIKATCPNDDDVTACSTYEDKVHRCIEIENKLKAKV